ncbi:MAG TPA: rRNA maturation RNase YbeY [Trueperaceae bacterium]|nr:rRNA maturation RNase YbeY [Trueperaceae bacterium]
MPLELIMQSQQSVALELLEQSLNSYLNSLKITQIVSLILIDDAQMKEFNLRDRGIDKSTDVLSYPLFEPDDIDMPKIEQLGDVFISLETAQKQAIEHKHSLEDEVLVLAAHGITHLRGFDHDSPENWQIFLSEQKIVLEHKNAI